MEDSFSHEAFSQNLNTKFDVPVGEDQNIELELAEISELKNYKHGQEEFSLVFRGPNDAFLGQGTRLLKHDQLGALELFIVPIRQDQKGYYYEAVFNRLTK
jgi:uncharacterized protein DUF6916